MYSLASNLNLCHFNHINVGQGKGLPPTMGKGELESLDQKGKMGIISDESLQDGGTV